MEVCVKQEKIDTGFKSGSGNMAAPWEVYGSWVDTSESSHPREYPQKSAELIIPFGERSTLMNNDFDYDENINRAKREFVPDEKKDNGYWNKRLKNNASARRSRMKKKVMEHHMEEQLQELQRENIELKYELAALKRHFANKMDTKHTDEVSSASRSDLSMRAGSASDSNDSSSVASEGDTYHGYDADSVVSSPMSALTSSATNRHMTSTTFPYQEGWHIPFNYSFLQYSVIDKDRKDSSSSVDNDVEAMTKIPHKFRHKKDFHSAFYA